MRSASIGSARGPWVVLMAFGFATACAPKLETGCSSTAECAQGQVCYVGQCVEPMPGEFDLGTGSGDVGAREDAAPPAEQDTGPSVDADDPSRDAKLETDGGQPVRDAEVVEDLAVPVDRGIQDACAPVGEELCNGADDDCDGQTDEGFDLGDACTTGVGGCFAVGAWRCGAEGRFCDAVVGVPRAEICNNEDDDCDGQTDESISQPCYEAPPNTEGVGLCTAGTRQCIFGVASACRFVGPVDETCDGRDEDCDGATDERVLGEDGCYDGDLRELDGPVSACRAGQEVCVEGGFVCAGQVLPDPASEDGCNGVNDDCDDVVDEDCSCVNGEPCEGEPVGACSPGVQSCDAEGRLALCVGAVAPSNEVCDGLDNDCDGATDEGTDEACVTADNQAFVGIGRCVAGVRACADGALAEVCVGEVAPSLEQCNGSDDDCDSRTDEDFSADLGAACTQGVGGCAQSGITVCAGDGAAVVCSVQALAPGVEVCNDVDDDCDGAVDEGVKAECYEGLAGTANIGQCRSGLKTCMAGRFGDCVGQVLPAPEECLDDGVDENCDGLINEDCRCANGASIDCGTDVGRCETGRQTCMGGQYGVCLGATDPSVEVCNGDDDDCDGSTDEGVAPVECYTADDPRTQGVGVCRGGLEACRSDVCAGEVVPSPEECDGEDDDCDGTIDDDVRFDEGGDCDVTGKLGVCRDGTLRCTGGQASCGQGVFPSREVCNRVDDDCNGSVNEAPIVETDVLQVVPQLNSSPQLRATWNGDLSSSLVAYTDVAAEAANQFAGWVRVFNAANVETGRSQVTPALPDGQLQQLKVGAVPAGANRGGFAVAYTESSANGFGQLWLSLLQADGALQLVNGAARLSVRSNTQDRLSVRDFDMDVSADGVAFAWIEDYVEMPPIVQQRLSFRRYSADFDMISQNLNVGPAANASKVTIARMTQGGVRFAIAVETPSLIMNGPTTVRVYTVDAEGGTSRFVDLPSLNGTSRTVGGIIANGDRFWVGTTASSFANETIQLQRLDRNAMVQGVELTVSGGAEARSAPGLARTSDGGALLAWRQREGLGQGGIYVSRITSAFGRALQNNGVRIGSTLSSAIAPRVIRDGRMVVWRSGDERLVGQARVGEFLCLP